RIPDSRALVPAAWRAEDLRVPAGAVVERPGGGKKARGAAQAADSGGGVPHLAEQGLKQSRWCVAAAAAWNPRELSPCAGFPAVPGRELLQLVDFLRDEKRHGLRLDLDVYRFPFPAGLLQRLP